MAKSKAPIINLDPTKSKKVNYQDEIEKPKAVTKIATKSMPCDACGWLKIKLNPLLESELTAEELRVVRTVKRQKYRIKKGQRYTHERGTFRGEEYKSNYFKSVHDICTKYGLYSSNAIN